MIKDLVLYLLRSEACLALALSLLNYAGQSRVLFAGG
jgi:hypothetical protein